MMVDLPSYGPTNRIRLGSFLRYRPLLLDYKGNEKLMNFQVKCVLTPSDIPFEKLRADKQDLLFVDNNNELIPYWIEKADSTEIIVWLKFSEIIPGKEVFWLYYGNGDFHGASDARTTFEFFEDWENSRDSNWVNGGGFTSADWEYATPALKTGNYRLHFKTGRGDREWNNMWWKGQNFTDFRFIAYLRADYSADDAGVLFRSQGSEVGSFRNQPGYRICLPLSSTGYFRLYRIDSDGGVTTLASYSAPDSTDTVRFEIMCYGSSIKVRIERPPRTYLTTLEATDTMWSSGYIGLGAPEWNSDRNPSFDTFLVAKYTSPEPSVSVGAEENP